MRRAAALPIVLLLALVSACSQSSSTLKYEGWDTFGAPIPLATATTLADVLADPAAHDGRTVRFEAVIAECCPKKGCWMTLVEGDDTVRVVFQDYGFFVPLDSAGRTVRLEGLFEVREVPLDEARHYLEDAGRLDEAAALTGPQQGYQITATGVLLRRD